MATSDWREPSCVARSGASSTSSPAFSPRASHGSRSTPAWSAVAPAPRALGLGDLERVRDELADRVAEARGALEDRAVADARNRELLEQMLERPADFKWLRISREELGLPGCGHWHSRPRYGLLGMLMGWWRVKISSGCPL